MERNKDIQKFYAKLDKFNYSGNKEKAIEYMEEQLDDAKKIRDLRKMAVVCNELGATYRIKGEVVKAKELYDTALDSLGNIGGDGTLDYAIMLMNAGNVYVAAQETDVALNLYKKAQSIFQIKEFSDDYLMATLNNNISSIYRERGCFKEAEQAIEKAFRHISKISQANKELATTHINLGALRLKERKYIEARINYTAAIDIIKEKTNERDPNYSIAYAGLGKTMYYLGKSKEAEVYLKKALQLIKRDFGLTKNYKVVEKELKKIQNNINSKEKI